MSTQTGGGTPHTCKAVEHCHTLNEQVSDITAELATLRTLVGTWREELADYRAGSLEWHNALAHESRAHDVAIATNRRAIEELVAAVRRPAPMGALEYHCETCFCEAAALRGQATR